MFITIFLFCTFSSNFCRLNNSNIKEINQLKGKLNFLHEENPNFFDSDVEIVSKPESSFLRGFKDVNNGEEKVIRQHFKVEIPTKHDQTISKFYLKRKN